MFYYDVFVKLKHTVTKNKKGSTFRRVILGAPSDAQDAQKPDCS